MKTPFFIYPAYWEPRMIIFLCWKFKATHVSLSTSGIRLLAWNYPYFYLKITSIENIIVSALREIFLKFFFGWANEHVCHEKSMISTCANNSNSYTIFFVITCIAINNIKAFSSIKVVFSKVFDDWKWTVFHWNVNLSPSDIFLAGLIFYNSFSGGRSTKLNVK